MAKMIDRLHTFIARCLTVAALLLASYLALSVTFHFSVSGDVMKLAASLGCIGCFIGLCAMTNKAGK